VPVRQWAGRAPNAGRGALLGGLRARLQADDRAVGLIDEVHRAAFLLGGPGEVGGDDRAGVEREGADAVGLAAPVELRANTILAVFD
jgi:hypothetical protein